ncbi:MAG: ribonuclease R [Gemmataceae bacterium]
MNHPISPRPAYNTGAAAPRAPEQLIMDLTAQILAELAQKNYQPLKPKAFARKLGITDEQYPEFRRLMKSLIKSGRVQLGGNNVLRRADQFGATTGIYRRTNSGHGYVRPHTREGDAPADIFIRDGDQLDAATGDEVMIRINRRASRLRDASGEVVQILNRATRTFVGTYFERDGQGLVRIDGTAFPRSIVVGDAGAKGVKPQDKVVIDMIRFPTPDERGEGVITQVLGPLGEPGVDLLSIIHGFGLPQEFPPEALHEAACQADAFREGDFRGRTDFTQELVITIDPADAKDFDDAVTVTIDPGTGHWVLTVHIADVGAFASRGGALDAEARKRATSVYLPQRVIPMFPEVISNGLASLQPGKVRFVKTVIMEFQPGGGKGATQFANGVIRSAHRFNYDEVQQLLDSDFVPPAEHPAPPSPDILQMLRRMRDLAALLRKRRFKRGSLELTMPEAVLEYDDRGQVKGAHFAKADESHSIIEEFMLAANEAVAEHLTALGVPFLRRVHPAPKEEKLDEFAQFAELLGYPLKRSQDRHEIQRVLRLTAKKPERAAIHYALLRSLKQATYSPIQDEHYALASQHYCHFTSPIRRYPDLVVHRILDQWIRTGKTSAHDDELKILGEHCSRLERRAEQAERELVKLKLLQHLRTRVGEELAAVVTGVAEYGFFAQAEEFPAEGLVHVRTMTDDFYHLESDARMLVGGRTKNRYRLGDPVRVIVANVDVQKRILDFRVVPPVITKKPKKKSREES